MSLFTNIYSCYHADSIFTLSYCFSFREEKKIAFQTCHPAVWPLAEVGTTKLHEFPNDPSIRLKGSLTRDFRLQVFFINQCHSRISPRIFEKIQNDPRWNTWGPGGHWFMTTSSRQSRVRLPLSGLASAAVRRTGFRKQPRKFAPRTLYPAILTSGGRVKEKAFPQVRLQRGDFLETTNMLDQV